MKMCCKSSSSPPPPPVLKVAGVAKAPSKRRRIQLRKPGSSDSAGASTTGKLRKAPSSSPRQVPKLAELAARTQPPKSGTKRGEDKGPLSPRGGFRTKMSSGEARPSRSFSSDGSTVNNFRTSCSTRGRIPGKSAAPPTSTICLSRLRTPSWSHRPARRTFSAHETMSRGRLGQPCIISNRSSGTSTRSSASSMAIWWPFLSVKGTVTSTGWTPNMSPSFRRWRRLSEL
mmetsp:Transcript_45416/g.132164  ORF Transcript_45416/g.132164 Transcript_45416/m.132164 type:complete len:229 (-) Transcript_45416:1361-2047(-)